LDEQGIRRTDEGMLGAGIYFAADPAVCAKVKTIKREKYCEPEN